MLELEKRKARNKLYSLRAFARDLGVRSSRLSEIFNGKAGLSPDKASKYAKNLNLSKEDTDLFLDLVESVHARSKVAKEMAKERLRARREIYNTLDEDKFCLISDWYHFGIMEYIVLENSVHSYEGVAKHLGITLEEATEAIQRLLKLKLIEKINNRYVLSKTHNETTNDVPSFALKNYNKQLLQKAINSIDERPIDERDNTAAIFTFNKKDIDEVKHKIREFRRQIMQEYEVKADRNSVYCLSVQFFELTTEGLEDDD